MNLESDLNQNSKGNHLDQSVEGVIKTIFDATKTAARSAMDQTKETLAAGTDLFIEGEKKSLSIIRKYPIESALTCFAVGYLSGFLLSRRA